MAKGGKLLTPTEGDTVTIEGTLTPSVHLPTGQRTTVAYTAIVQRRVDYGYIKIVDVIPAVTPEPAAPADERTDSEREADEQAEAARQELGVPSRGASRVDWATFLLGKAVITQAQHDDPELGRNDLLELWDGWDGQPVT